MDDGKKIYVKKSVMDFISCLIQHIPPEQFKVVRYYGMYGKNPHRYYNNYFKKE